MLVAPDAVEDADKLTDELAEGEIASYCNVVVARPVEARAEVRASVVGPKRR